MDSSPVLRFLMSVSRTIYKSVLARLLGYSFLLMKRIRNIFSLWTNFLCSKAQKQPVPAPGSPDKYLANGCLLLFRGSRRMASRHTSDTNSCLESVTGSHPSCCLLCLGALLFAILWHPIIFASLCFILLFFNLKVVYIEWSKSEKEKINIIY